VIEGLVLGGTNNQFEVECPDNLVRICGIKGKILKESQGYYNPLAPGDRVSIVPDENDAHQGQIHSLIPRRNHFVRFNQKGKSPQMLAANLDLIVIVTTPAEPPFRPRFVDRLLVQAEAEHIEPLILVNKCDLAPDADLAERLSDWERLGYSVLQVSAQTGFGLDILESRLKGRLSAFVGQSGVGKSSILNALDASLQLRTGGLCEKYDRGSHTTVKGMLFHLPLSSGGSADIVDTPGVRRFVIHDIQSQDLALYFPEMEGLVGQCSWGLSCSHQSEAGCKILEAVYSGVILEQRYESWRRIKEEIETGNWSD